MYCNLHQQCQIQTQLWQQQTVSEVLISHHRENPWMPGWVPALQGRNSCIQKQIVKRCLAS